MAEFSQIDLATVDAYERKDQSRTTVLGHIASVRGDEPWAGYDGLTATDPAHPWAPLASRDSR